MIEKAQYHVVIYSRTQEPYIKSSHSSRAAAKQAAAAFCEPGKAAQVEEHMRAYRAPRLWVQRTLAGMEVG